MSHRLNAQIEGVVSQDLPVRTKKLTLPCTDHLMSHQLFMQRCLELANTGSGYVAPNPMVGAVLEFEGKVYSEGYHKKFGGPHAEVEAIQGINDLELLRRSTLYVNLEPCSHFGKTPPCTDLIIAKGIKQVVLANRDPNKLVNGEGIRKLTAAGVHVISGIMEEEGRWLNRRFFTFHERRRPYIILKWAQSMDGFVAPVHNKGVHWISNKVSRALVHRWRSEEQAILAGKQTVLVDNPKLTARNVTGPTPVRIVIDPDASLPRSLHVFNKKAQTIIFNNLKDEQEGNIQFVRLPGGTAFTSAMMQHLYNLGIQSVLVEGGSFTLRSFIEQNLWDEARIFTGNQLLKAGTSAPEIDGKELMRENIAGDDLVTLVNSSAL